MKTGGSPFRSHATLVLCAILHAFTHAYQVALVPLYLLIASDLRLSGVKAAALIVSLLNGTYFLLSYPSGMLADRFDRKRLLGLGLAGNAAAILLMGTTGNYGLLLALAGAAGLFGTLFHPAANALVAAHYPRNPGLAVGLMGIGSGVGFFAGSQYSGWRAEHAGASWWARSAWQLPCVELGLAGLAMATLFLLLAEEATGALAPGRGQPMGTALRRKVLGVAGLLSLRDFAGTATLSLVSIYLQKAHGYSTRQTGWILGAMGLVSVAATPLSVWLTSGSRRLPGLAGIIIATGLLQLPVPHVSLSWILLVLAAFQVFHLSGYAVAEVAMVELLPTRTRGRGIGLLLTVCGTVGALSPWAMGLWTDLLGEKALRPAGYVVPFRVLGLVMAGASPAVWLMKRLGQAHPRTPSQAVLEAAGEPAI